MAATKLLRPIVVLPGTKELNALRIMDHHELFGDGLSIAELRPVQC